MFTPKPEILEKYAQVLVNFALNSGEGIKKGEVVQLTIPDVAKPLAKALQTEVLKAGAHPMLRLIPTGLDRNYFELASEEQLKFFPEKYLRARAELLDHNVAIIADVDPRELAEVDPQKILTSQRAKKKYRDWLVAKENKGEFTWTIGLWGTEAKAREVDLSIEEYWEQIAAACFLNEADPIAKWKEVTGLQKEILKKINSLEIQTLKLTGPHVDLELRIGEKRKWQGGSGRNIPSFEIFTSPDWRGTNGWIEFNQPLYRYGQVIRDIRLEFKDGLVTKATAKEGQKFIEEMLRTENANKIGEFSLTDRRMSKITHVMAETLFDENIGGPQGNTHLALGMAYKDCYAGDPSELSEQDWDELGYNDSSEHTDIISTTERTVMAQLRDGSEKLIYAEGEFKI